MCHLHFTELGDNDTQSACNSLEEDTLLLFAGSFHFRENHRKFNGIYAHFTLHSNVMYVGAIFWLIDGYALIGKRLEIDIRYL